MTNDFSHTRRTLATRSAAAAALFALGGWLREDQGAHAREAPGMRQAMAGPAPALFIGHGSPMNVLRDNGFTSAMGQWGERLGRPRAILMVSAHWLTERDTRVSTTAEPSLIYDFTGFPKSLYEVRYPAPGAPVNARQAALRLAPRRVGEDPARGLDHGAWTVLKLMYPAADVPVFQLSIDITRDGPFHLALGRALAALRGEGVMVVGSGNLVHNLSRLDRGAGEASRATEAWAQDFDAAAAQAIDAGDADALASWEFLSERAATAVPFPDHYFPLLYAAGAAQRGETPRHVFEGFHEGTISMRCVQWG
ncbi:MAG: 4,5-DOPA dioxygenase extradiol [Hydrogenophaga sp.]|nr:4,5-DOPA dioxygenase extradiol [Hydrogenophaga sp.]